MASKKKEETVQETFLRIMRENAVNGRRGYVHPYDAFCRILDGRPVPDMWADDFELHKRDAARAICAINFEGRPINSVTEPLKTSRFADLFHPVNASSDDDQLI